VCGRNKTQCTSKTKGRGKSKQKKTGEHLAAQSGEIAVKKKKRHKNPKRKKKQKQVCKMFPSSVLRFNPVRQEERC